MNVGRLRKIKHAHEDWVRRMSGLDRNRGTAVVRMIGAVRGNAVELSRPTASAAVLNSDDRFPEFPLSYEQYGFEIDLRHLPGEGTEMYWTTAKAAIDEVIEHKLKEAVRHEDVRHLSVFAFARLPLLVYLGSRLDDTYEVALYQRHRSTEAWAWPESTATVEFKVESQPAEGAPSAGAVLVLNISGTIQPDELPPELSTLPRLVVAPVGEIPGVDIIDSPDALYAFIRTVRTLLSQLEGHGQAPGRPARVRRSTGVRVRRARALPRPSRPPTLRHLRPRRHGLRPGTGDLVKLTNYFKAFLENTVNLNQSRLDLLDQRVAAIVKVLEDNLTAGCAASLNTDRHTAQLSPPGRRSICGDDVDLPCVSG